jgi:lipopolysaccharide export system permease protein
VLTTFVLATVQILDLVDLAFAKGVPASRVMKVFGYMLPSYLELTFPMALLLAIVAAFARMSRDGEVLALRAAGLSLAQLTRPLFVFSAVVAGFTFVLSAWTSPWANRGLEHSIREMARRRMTAALTAGVFSPWVNDIVVYVGEIERRCGMVKNIMMSDERDRERPRTIFATDGQLATDNVAQMARFHMRDGTILTDYVNPKSFDKTDFQSFDLNVSLGTDEVKQRASFMDEPRRMDWDTLRASLAQPDQEPDVLLDRRIEVQRRLAVPFSCVLLPLIGVPLGVQRSRAVRSRGVVVGLAVILVYYFLVTGAVTLVHQGLLAPAAALWAPNVALALAGLFAFRNAAASRLRR